MYVHGGLEYPTIGSGQQHNYIYCLLKATKNKKVIVKASYRIWSKGPLTYASLRI